MRLIYNCTIIYEDLKGGDVIVGDFQCLKLTSYLVYFCYYKHMQVIRILSHRNTTFSTNYDEVPVLFSTQLT